MLVRRGAHHRAVEPGTNLIDTGDVVGVVVRQQDHIQPAAGFFDSLDDRLGVSGINDGGGARAALAQQPGVIVLQDGDGRCCDCHLATLSLVELLGNGWTCYRLAL